jgi:DNA-binding CsgD family transcriptional regulator
MSAPHLTSREMEVLKLVAEGYANKQIAGKLVISLKTVEKHREHVMSKLHLHSAASLVSYTVSNRVFEYRLSWEQFMGGGRGLNMNVTTDDWETMRLVWRRLIRDAVPEMVRGAVVTCNGQPFDPTGPWPRPSVILP